MDRTGDVMSIEAQVMHAALAGDEDEVWRRLGRLTDHELGGLEEACALLVRLIRVEFLTRRD